MKLRTFERGGIHPPHNKKFTEHKEIENAAIPAKAVFPLRQHAGAPAQPVVEIGQEVKAGEKIAEASSFISAPVHSSIDGVVKAIEPHITMIGVISESIIIEAAENQEPIAAASRNTDDLTKEEIVETVKDAGIVGLGGAAFPTFVKLSPPKETVIDSLIINGCECEPFLTCDHRMMVEQADELIEGIKLLLKASGAGKAYIGVEANKPDAIELLTNKTEPLENIEVIPLETKYPQGSEKHLIKAVLNREIPIGGLPGAVGVLVQNIGTTISVFEACSQGKPLIERVVTVTGRAVNNPKNLRVRLGTPVEQLIEECGGFSENVAKVISGGPMTGFSLFDMSVPVVKGTSGIVALTGEEVKDVEIQPCVRCANCVVNCPMGLEPLNITAYVAHEMIEEAMEAGLMNCIECGICSYVCPANRPLVPQLKFGKSLAASLQKKE